MKCMVRTVAASTCYYVVLQRRRHELVYAKLSGYPYWPAKVMEVKSDRYEVRFFGSEHRR